jgi:hypothetical protein
MGGERHVSQARVLHPSSSWLRSFSDLTDSMLVLARQEQDAEQQHQILAKSRNLLMAATAVLGLGLGFLARDPNVLLIPGTVGTYCFSHFKPVATAAKGEPCLALRVATPRGSILTPLPSGFRSANALLL